MAFSVLHQVLSPTHFCDASPVISTLTHESIGEKNFSFCRKMISEYSWDRFRARFFICHRISLLCAGKQRIKLTNSFSTNVKGISREKINDKSLERVEWLNLSLMIKLPKSRKFQKQYFKTPCFKHGESKNKARTDLVLYQRDILFSNMLISCLLEKFTNQFLKRR